MPWMGEMGGAGPLAGLWRLHLHTGLGRGQRGSPLTLRLAVAEALDTLPRIALTSA